MVDNGSPISAIGIDDQWTATVTGMPDGYHFIEAKAWDYHDNVAMDGIYVHVENNPPDLTIHFPSENYNVGGSVVINGTTYDNDEAGVKSVEVRVNDGSWVLASGTETWSYTWDTSALTVGEYHFEVRSTDHVNNVCETQLVNIKKTDWANLGPYANEGSGNATYPSIATDGFNIYIAFQEDVGGVQQVFVKKWTGSTWELLGGSELNLDNTKDARDPTISFDVTNNVLDCAWREYDSGASVYKLYAKRWDGSAWTQLGAGPIDNNASLEIRYPVLKHRRGSLPIIPFVAWIEHNGYEGDGRQVYCKKWQGGAWTSVGGLINTDYGNNDDYRVRDLDMGFKEEKPIVIWSQDVYYHSGTDYRIYTRMWSGTSWDVLGSNAISSGSQNYYPTIEADDTTGIIYAAFSHKSGAFYILNTRKFEGGSWSDLGSSPNVDTAQHAYHPKLAIYNSTPYLAWYESDSVLYHVYIKRWNSTDWEFLAQTEDYGLNVNPLHTASVPSFVFSSGVIHIAFAEDDGAQNKIFTKYYNVP